MSLFLPRTYNINVSKIFSKRRGQYDLEDEFLWFYEIVSRDRSWTFSKKEALVTLSDDAEYSLIQLDCPNIELMNQKQNFVEYCGKESWVPHSIIIRLKQDGDLSEDSLRSITEMEYYNLLFLKKAGPGIGGGFDVTPIYNGRSHDHLLENIETAIKEQNVNPNYRRKIFVLQAGISRPLLTSLGQKIDIRLYMLLVGNGRGRVAFYACRVGNIRNTAAYPYDPTSDDPKIQITNVAQNRRQVKDTSSITRVFSEETYPTRTYQIIFKKFLYIAQRVGVIYGPLVGIGDVKPFVTLLGLDAVVDSQTLDPMIVEINRRPTVYTPTEASKLQYSSTIFMSDVFRLGVRAIVIKNVGQVPPESSSFVLVHVKDE